MAGTTLSEFDDSTFEEMAAFTRFCKGTGVDIADLAGLSYWVRRMATRTGSIDEANELLKISEAISVLSDELL